MITANDIFTYLATELDVDTTELTTESELFSTQIVDSFSLISLIAFLEDKANFRMSPLDVNLDNLDTVERMLAYIATQTS